MANLVRGFQPSYLGLGEIAERLNRLQSLKGAEREAWAEAKGIVSSSVDRPEIPKGVFGLALHGPKGSYPSTAVRRFNKLAMKAPITLHVEQATTKRKRLATTALQTPHGDLEWVVWLLWRFFFQDEGWKRLKCCRNCRRWYVDKTRNRKAEGCSQGCTNRYWNRERRRAAHHRQKTRERRRNRK